LRSIQLGGVAMNIPNDWKVKRLEKFSAIQVAQTIAKNQQSDTKIHGENGQIRAGNSYGNDQCPPKDKK